MLYIKFTLISQESLQNSGSVLFFGKCSFHLQLSNPDSVSCKDSCLLQSESHGPVLANDLLNGAPVISLIYFNFLSHHSSVLVILISIMFFKLTTPSANLLTVPLLRAGVFLFISNSSSKRLPLESTLD